jgi:hypothetical protein
VVVADTNNIIILFPQAIPSLEYAVIWGGYVLDNPYGCWDWYGMYGENADQKGGELIGFINFGSISWSSVLIDHACFSRGPNVCCGQPSQSDYQWLLGR